MGSPGPQIHIRISGGLEKNSTILVSHFSPIKSELVKGRTEGLCIVLQKKNLDDSKIRPGLRVPDLAFKLPYVVYTS